MLDEDTLSLVLTELNLADLHRLGCVCRHLFKAVVDEQGRRSFIGSPYVVLKLQHPTSLALLADGVLAVGGKTYGEHVVRIQNGLSEATVAHTVRAVAVSEGMRLYVLDEHHVLMGCLPEHGLPQWYDAASPLELDFEEATSLALIGERLLVMDTGEARVVALDAASLQLQMVISSLWWPMGAATVENQLYITEMGADRVAVTSLAGVRQRTLQLDAVYGLVAPQGIAAIAACSEHEALLVVACDRCALVMSTRGIVMQRVLLGRRRLGCVVCDDSHVYVTEYERGRVWRLVVW